MNKLRRQYYLIFISLETFAATESDEVSSGRRPDVDAVVCPRKFHWLTFDNMFKMHGTITYLNSMTFDDFFHRVYWNVIHLVFRGRIGARLQAWLFLNNCYYMIIICTMLYFASHVGKKSQWVQISYTIIRILQNSVICLLYARSLRKPNCKLVVDINIGFTKNRE
jgi:hypothetical protein